MPWTEYADCPSCGKAVAIYNPKGGDGSTRFTHWHKNSAGEWCRAELYEDHEWATIRRTRNPACTAPARPVRQAGCDTNQDNPHAACHPRSSTCRTETMEPT